MKKFFVLLILACLLLTGCKENKTDAEQETTKPDPNKIVTAVQVGSYDVTNVELNYFYIDAINTFYSNYRDYLSYLLDSKASLNEQIADSATGETWADYFVKQAYNTIKSTYAVYDAAMAAGFQLSEEQQADIDTAMQYLVLYGMLYNFKDTDAYLCDMYGAGATVESYTEYYTKCVIAEAYYNKYSEDLEYTIDELTAYQSSVPYRFNSYSYAIYYLNADRFYAEDAGTMDANGKVTYTQEEAAAAVEAARVAAEQLAGESYETVHAFDIAINQLDVNRPAGSNSVGNEEIRYRSTKYEDIQYSHVNTLFWDFLIGNDRNEGDLAVIANISGTGDNKTIKGFYVVRYESCTNNDFAMKNVRHILVKFVKLGSNGKPINSSNTNYTDAEKKYAKDEAEKLLAQWMSGDMTEESFAALANKESDDGDGTTGGLYENIYPGQMVENFEDWCFDPDRRIGDVEIIETEYGYHLMYFVGDTEQTYRNYLIQEAMRGEDTKAWYEALVETLSFTVLTDAYINKEITIA